jgi:hypothetical protein
VGSVVNLRVNGPEYKSLSLISEREPCKDVFLSFISASLIPADLYKSPLRFSGRTRRIKDWFADDLCLSSGKERLRRGKQPASSLCGSRKRRLRVSFQMMLSWGDSVFQYCPQSVAVQLVAEEKWSAIDVLNEWALTSCLQRFIPKILASF